MVRWPSEQEIRSSLAAEGRPRLLLLEAGPPPVVIDPLEDWIRMPADDAEMWARLESLRRRWEAPRKPKLDQDGVLTWADRWVALSPLEARLASVLLEKFTSMVTYRALVDATQSPEDARRNSLDVQLHRLRRRLAPIGLVIRTVRKRGYVLEPGQVAS
jgi:DNA-binding response OmpR family regulator